MSESPIKPMELAKLAGAGIAEALRLRNTPALHIPRIICGIPPEIFSVEIKVGSPDTINVSKTEIGGLKG